VALALQQQLPREAPGGAAVCVYHRGRPVVDLWGGTRDGDGSPWRADTTAPSFSTTKGVLSTLVHLLVHQGRARYDDPVASHWPEFAAAGKDRITIRQALCHEAGLYRATPLLEHAEDLRDYALMKDRLAAATPVHVPGAAHGYHALTYGWLVGGLAEAIGGRPLAQLLAEELAEPLALDGLYIGLPDHALDRRAWLIHDDGVSRPPQESPAPGAARRRRWRDGALRAIGMHPDEFRAALMPFREPFDWNARETVQAVIPAANGQFTACSLARMYAMIAEGGRLDDVRLLSADRVRRMGEVQNRTRDRVLFLRMHWRLGYHRVFSFGGRLPEAFGHFGYGGSGAWCDPSRRLAVALTLNSGVGTPVGDLRIARLNRRVLQALERLR
jgi:CubicO group peptidase (beta-lactamase class C family)